MDKEYQDPSEKRSSTNSVSTFDPTARAVEVSDKPPTETIDHPFHYGGKNNPYEAIKVIEAWSLGFRLGNTVKYICRAGKKYRQGVDYHRATLEDLKKAQWYLRREIERLEEQ